MPGPFFSEEETRRNMAKYGWTWHPTTNANDWMDQYERELYANYDGYGTFSTKVHEEAQRNKARIAQETAAKEAAAKKAADAKAVEAYKATQPAANPSEAPLTKAGLDDYYKKKTLLNMRGRGTNNQAQLGGQSNSTIVRTLLGS